MNILFIGNSYTYYHDLEKLVEGLCRDNGHPANAFRITKGSRKLIHYKDTDDPTTKELMSALACRQFDVCFLQEQSLLPITEYQTFTDGLNHVAQLLKPQNPELILYATWARKAGCPDLEEYGWTSDSMTELLAAAYRSAASSLHAKVSAVGLSFQNAIQLDPTLELYFHDGSHPSYLGSCLAALTHYHTLFGSFPEHTQALSLNDQELSVLKQAIHLQTKI